jgi:hypothetical protein
MRVLEIVLVDLEGDQMHETLVEDVFVVAHWQSKKLLGIGKDLNELPRGQLFCQGIPEILHRLMR